MSLMWLDDTDMESAEYDDAEAEAYDDSESEYGDDSRTTAARRRRQQAQQRRVTLARRRQAMSRARALPPARPGTAVAPVAAQRQTVAAIRNLDLETKVQEDNVRTALAAQNKRMSRSEYAAVVGAATNQFIESFDAPDNPFFKAGLRFAPLLLLSPQKRGTGFESVVRDPRVIGLAAVAAITFAGDQRNRGSQASDINIQASAELDVASGADTFFADVVDSRGRVVAGNVTWASGNPAIASIDANGNVTPLSEGTVAITATFDGIVRRIRVRVFDSGAFKEDDDNAAAANAKPAKVVAKAKAAAGNA